MNNQQHRIRLPRLAVMACPQHAGRHPFHDQRYLVTEGTTIEHGHDPRPGEWATKSGSLVATMRDCAVGTTAEIAHRCNAYESMVAALEMDAAARLGADKALPVFKRHGYTGPASAPKMTAFLRDAKRAALATINT